MKTEKKSTPKLKQVKKPLNYDQVPESEEKEETYNNCTYPKCGCPHFMC